jgi:hypothetical protein
VRFVLLVALALAVSACGGPYAGLSREQADKRASTALRSAESDGTLQRELGQAIQETPTGAMGRAGAARLGAPPRLTGEKKLSEGSAPDGYDAWVGSYAIAGVGSALSVCVYVWDGGSAVDVRGRC